MSLDLDNHHAAISLPLELLLLKSCMRVLKTVRFKRTNCKIMSAPFCPLDVSGLGQSPCCNFTAFGTASCKCLSVVLRTVRLKAKTRPQTWTF